MEGWIKMHRKMLDWEWYDDINTKVLFLHLLLTANHKEKKWKGQTVLRGQKLTSLEHLAEETNLSVQQIRTSLKKLKSTNEITIKSTSKNTLITIEKYSDYQDKDEDDNIQNNTQNNKQITTNKNDKNVKKIYYGEYQNVFFTEKQYKDLQKEFPKDYKDRIQQLDCYMQSTGKKYKDCLATIRTWAKKDGYVKPVEEKEIVYVENTMTEEEYFAKVRGLKNV